LTCHASAPGVGAREPKSSSCVEPGVASEATSPSASRISRLAAAPPTSLLAAGSVVECRRAAQASDAEVLVGAASSSARVS
jgi:hypothetical protein